MNKILKEMLSVCLRQMPAPMMGELQELALQAYDYSMAYKTNDPENPYIEPEIRRILFIEHFAHLLNEARKEVQ